MLKPKCIPITMPRPQPPFTVYFSDGAAPSGHVGKIEAVKMLRHCFDNIHLKEAKELVETNFGVHPDAWYSVYDLAILIAHIAKEHNNILRDVRRAE